MTKVLADTALTGRRGVNVVERVILEMGFAWHPTSGDLDTGVDGIIDIRDPVTQGSTNRIIQVQSKATLGRLPAESSTGFHYVCDENDLAHWLGGNVPIILVRVRPPDEAYWIPLKEYFAEPTRRRSRRIEFDKQRDRLTVAARDRLMQMAVERRPGLVFARPPRPETLVSNLLEVTRFAPSIFVARSALRDRHAIIARLDENTGDGRRPEAWKAADKQIYSFDDLDAPDWRGIVEEGTTERHAAAQFANAGDEPTRHLFVELLGRALREMVQETLSFHGKHEFFYFRPTPDLAPLELAYPGLVNASDRIVFRGYGKRKDSPEQPSYYRHCAFRWAFRRFEGTWYLEVNPTYHYTRDGTANDSFYEERLKKMKRLELNGAIVGQLMMWKHVLAPAATDGELFAPKRAPYPFLGFGDWCRLDVGYGVPDDDWVASEEEDATDGTDADGDAVEEATMSDLFDGEEGA